jgi:predicted Rossmann fold nucleotide-binding protein DprA/Smf involved in DNA uptake
MRGFPAPRRSKPMPQLQGVTPHHQKIYDFLFEGSFVTQDKLVDADKVAVGTKLPKGTVANLLLDLEKKGFVKRVARGKAAGYYITKVPEESGKPKSGEGEFSADDIF